MTTTTPAIDERGLAVYEFVRDDIATTEPPKCCIRHISGFYDVREASLKLLGAGTECDHLFEVKRTFKSLSAAKCDEAAE